MPLTAAIAGTLIFILFLFSYDVLVVKLASHELRRYADGVCQTVARRPTIHKNALRQFRSLVKTSTNEQPLGRSTITSAEIVLPTMPEDASFFSRATYDSSTMLPTPPFGNRSSPTIKICELLGATCREDTSNHFPEDIEPTFRWDPSTSEDFPKGNPSGSLPFWNSVYDPGAQVGCVFSAKVRRWFGGAKLSEDIRAVVAYRTEPLGKRVKADPEYPTFGGLLIAVAPYIPVRAELPRYRFHEASSRSDNYPLRPLGSSYGPGADFLGRYSPLHMFSSRVSPLPKPSFEDFPGNVYQYQSFNRNFLAPPLKPNDTVPAPVFMPGIDDLSPYNSTPALDLSAKDDLLAACMNPPVLMRNIFLSTLLELSSRHGLLRNRTQVMMINPRHRNVPRPSGPNSKPSINNQPVLIVPLGSDLALPQFELPFVTYNTGNPTTHPMLLPFRETVTVARDSLYTGAFGTLPQNPTDPRLTDPFERLAAPFNLASAPVPRQSKQIASLITSQLRMCYHLYGRGRLQRFDVRNMSTEVLGNGGFEPAEFIYPEGSDAFELTRPGAAYSIGRPWDQECPFDSPTPCPYQVGRYSRKLTAAELASVLGSAQMNPGGLQPDDPDLSPPLIPPAAPGPQRNGRNGIDPPVRSKVDYAGPYDLRADLIGLIRYWLGLNDGNRVRLASRNTFPASAIVPPGLHPILDYNYARAGYPFIELPNNMVARTVFYRPLRSSLAPDDTLPPLMLVLHRRLEPFERDEIRNELDQYRSRNGYIPPITVVYFPVMRIDDDPQVWADIREAFNIPDDPIDEAGRLANLFINNSPYNLRLYEPGTDAYTRYNTGDPESQWVEYRRFWYDRLWGFQFLPDDDAGKRDNPVNLAEWVFYDRLLQVTQRY